LKATLSRRDRFNSQHWNWATSCRLIGTHIRSAGLEVGEMGKQAKQPDWHGLWACGDWLCAWDDDTSILAYRSLEDAKVGVKHQRMTYGITRSTPKRLFPVRRQKKGEGER
jgi:hypothetical protein